MRLSVLRPSFWFALLSASLCVLLASSTARGDTIIPGGNIINQTWTVAGSPYVVQGDIRVPPGTTLTIEAGVTVRFASTDALGTGRDTARVEVNVEGSLVVNGTTDRPAVFTGTSSSPYLWYGIIAAPSATSVLLQNATITGASVGVTTEAGGSALRLLNSTLSQCGGAVQVSAGAPVIDSVDARNLVSQGVNVSNGSVAISGSHFQGGVVGINTAGSASIALVNTVVTGFSDVGVLLGGTAASTITNATIHANGNAGVMVSGTGTLALRNSLVTSNGSYGVRRLATSVGAVTITYCDVWNQSNNTTSATVGAGCISANPLYVSATNLRITSRSPARFGAEGGSDMGALPYAADDTPGLYGTLWTNTRLTLAGSPYTVAGDLTVPPTISLTIEPGVVINAATSDIMQAGRDTARVEVVVSGTLAASGTAALPINFRSLGTAGAYQWGGLLLTPSATATTLEHLSIQSASVALSTETLQAVRLSNLSVLQCGSGISVSQGTPVLDSVTVRSSVSTAVGVNNGTTTISNSLLQGGVVGLSVASTAGVSALNTVVTGFSDVGVLLGGTAASTITNATIHANGNAGVMVSGTGTLALRNSLVTSNGSYGVRRLATSVGAVTITYCDVWNQSNNTTSATVGAGCISANPLYVSGTDLRLQSGSFAIDSANAAGAPDRDLVGAVRPLDGDGIDGAAYDMGAYEFVPMVVCGNGVREGSEICDDGTRNGTYGFCNGTCSGAGIRCGDNMRNGPEECDDGNTTNADACTNACLNARCGDNIVQAGVEACDDGNAVETDACRNTCIAARCGDGVVRAGTEECDDNNAIETDACRNTCVAARCGDGVVQVGVEACDDGASNGMTGRCNITCTMGAAPRCGDGMRNGTEECDDGNSVDTDACRNTCVNARCGDGVTRAGTEECDDANSVDTDACTSACRTARCGDGIVRASVETCDDGASNGEYGFCNATCAGPGPRCGDGMRNGTEACDDGSRNGTYGYCNATCAGAGARCGDGMRNGDEDCDDGNATNTDACLNSCRGARCGDGVVYGGVETCDDGADNGMPGRCASSCTGAAPRCGDGTRNGSESCDDGSRNGTYGYCNATCTGAGARCGDGMRNGDEECDDGNPSNTDACLNACRNAACGDGVTRAGVEQCDDGNSSNTDGCLNTCNTATCGDGLVRAGSEDCDDGNRSDEDGCLNTCRGASCGDGFVRSGVEQCDDSNTTAGDGCNAMCMMEVRPVDGGADAGDATASDAAIADAQVSADATIDGGADAATGDASVADGATSDASVADGAADAAVTDTAVTDAAVTDAATADATATTDAGAATDAGSGGGADGGTTPDPMAAGCGCRVGATSSTPWGSLGLLAMGIVATLRRRRARRGYASIQARVRSRVA